MLKSTKSNRDTTIIVDSLNFLEAKIKAIGVFIEGLSVDSDRDQDEFLGIQLFMRDVLEHLRKIKEKL